MRAIRRTAVSIAAAQLALLASTAVFAQTPAAPAPAEKKVEKKEDKKALETVTVTGKRAALQSAQLLKQNADEIVDSIVADDIGKLPDRSVTEVLQRIVGVTIDRTMAKNDPEHHSVEGSGVIIRGLSYVRSELNGRDSFSANGGRSLNFEDVPPELMAGVDVYKNPSAERIEGAVSGLVNLRTALPFDYAGLRGAVSLSGTNSKLADKNTGSASAQISNRWSTDAGEFGALINVAKSDSATRTDAFQVEPYYPRSNIVNGQTVWVPKGAQWRTLEFERERTGLYGALQWRKNDISSTLTYFKSDYKMKWAERAIFAQVDSPYNITLDPGATFDDQGALLTGTMRAPADGGLNYGADTRGANRDSQTTDIGWNLSWKASDRWSFSTDLQLIKAKTASFDSTVATGVKIPKQTVNLSGGVPQLLFDDADRAHFANPANYYWAFTMEHLDKSKADSKAWRADAKFNFDHAVLQDLRFGVRLTDREANTTDTGYNWAAVTQPWMAWWYLAPGSLARLNDPRFSGDSHTHHYSNFFGGKTATPPSLIFPDVSLVNGYPASYAKLHGYAKTLCTEFNNGNSAPCFDFWNARNPDDAQYQNHQQEQTQAAYGQLRFEFENLGLDGTAGLRVVRTEAEALGRTTFTRTLPNIPPGANVIGIVPDIPNFSEEEKVKHSYINMLPSLNLRLKGGDGLQYRLALARAISRPDFTQLQAHTSLTQTADTRLTTVNGVPTLYIDRVNHRGEAKGNPLLKPVTSDQLDVTAEWYFAKAGSFTAAAFYKDIKDVIINQTRIRKQADTGGALHDFLVTAPINGAKGSAQGVELTFQRYLDMLPGWLSGFGVQANYTYVDSKTRLYTPVTGAYCSGGNNAANLNLNLNGCDTDGRSFGDLPLPQLSKNTFNFALLYDHGPWSARLAYSWRSKYLQAVNVNGTNGGDGTDTNPASPTFGQTNVAWALPTWGDDYGQLDGGVHYRFDNGLSIGLEAQNLNNAISRQLMQQHIGLKGRAWFASGRRYTLQMGYSF